MSPEELKAGRLEGGAEQAKAGRGMKAEGEAEGASAGAVKAEGRAEAAGAEAQREETGAQPPRTLLPGATIGVLGGGQLGRMMALSGSAMGYRFVALDPAKDAPCGQVTPQITAAYNDRDAARELARRSDVITYEFENVDAGVAALLTEESYVPQGSALLYTTQHRLREKAAIESAGVPVAPYRKVGSLAELEAAAADLGLPCVLKTATGGMTARDKPSSAGRKSWLQRSIRSRRGRKQIYRSWCWRNSSLLNVRFRSSRPEAPRGRSRASRLPRTFMWITSCISRLYLRGCRRRFNSGPVSWPSGLSPAWRRSDCWRLRCS